MSDQTPQQPPQKSWLVGHFEERPLEAHGAGWSKIWEMGKSDLWDRGKASPALVDVIEEHQDPGKMFYPFTTDGRRKRVLVPGCGRGYDVVMLALHGFDAYGLEISATGVAEAEEFATKESKDPGEANFGVNYHGQSRGDVKFVQNDFFASGWEGEIGGKFDLIYDYTFLCALHPTMRKDWATRMASLLNTDGLLTCLEFPMYKDRKLPGPPWGLNGVHWNLLQQGGDGLVSDEQVDANAGDDDSPGSFTRILYVQPERTYEAGQGTDMLSGTDPLPRKVTVGRHATCHNAELGNPLTERTEYTSEFVADHGMKTFYLLTGSHTNNLGLISQVE